VTNYSYLLRRLLLLPITLFAIILVNFVILNLVPGDPVTVVDRSSGGDPTRSANMGHQEDNDHLLFREHYGLTLPILFNTWWSLPREKVHAALLELHEKKELMSVQKYHKLRTLWGDRARYVMQHLLHEAKDPSLPLEMRKTAASLFIRGGTRLGYVGPTLTAEQKRLNQLIAKTNQLLSSYAPTRLDDEKILEEKLEQLSLWFANERGSYERGRVQNMKAFLLETRFFRYMKRVLLFDFGTLRGDSNKTVISEVAKRMKYSLTLAVIPLFATFGLCWLFGMLMAVKQNRAPDFLLNIFFLILFAIPVFVVGPFLIEKVALHHTLPFTSLSIPTSGFHSPDQVYRQMTSLKKFGDISLHLLLPLLTLMYGTLAVQARLSRTAFLEVLRQDYIRTAHAKGLPLKTILLKHVGRNGAITIVTSLAASLGVILGGSLIVETIFEINGFGRFFYEAIVSRDYNVVLFSAFAGSLLTLVGYILADIAYTLLDPRVALD